MIIHSIEVETFGCFLEPARFTFAPDRPNLVIGPNGSGKSTLFAALSAAFVISHRSGAADIRRWQPWGKDLPPRVTVVFECEGRLYRLTKVFLQRPQALLEKEEPRGFSPLAQGDAVEEQLPAFLGGAPRPGTYARPRSWLLAGLLWVPQHRLLETTVGQDVQESIRGAFGVQTQSPAVKTILAEIQRLYEQDWTPGGREKRHSPLDRLPAEIERLAGDVASLKAGLDELNTVRERYAQLEQTVRKLQGDRTLAAAEASQLERLVRERGEVASRLATAGLEKKNAEAEYGRLKGVLEARATLEIRRREAEQRRKDRAAARELAESELETAEAALQQARQRCRGQLDSLSHQLEQLRAPSPEVLRRLEQLAAQKTGLLAKLESALLHAEILPEADGRLEVLEGEPGGWVELRSQQKVRISGSPRVELRIPGFGRLCLTGPAESAAQLRDRLEETDREYARLTESCGGASIEELRERRLKADALALELDRWKNLQAAHDGGASPEAVACGAARNSVENARSLLEETERELRALEDESRRLAGEARTDAEIRQEMDRLALAAHGLEGSIRALQERLSAFPPDLDQRLERAQRSVNTLDERLESARRQLQEARDRLNQLQGREVYTALAEKEALLEQKRTNWPGNASAREPTGC